MSELTVTLTLPAETYDLLKQRAEAVGRTVQDEIVETLLASVSGSDDPPRISPLPLFSDEELWQAARSRLPAEEAEELEALHHKRDREGLSDEEKRRLAGLMKRYERFVLLRAEAAALLKQRGHDVSVLLRAS